MDVRLKELLARMVRTPCDNTTASEKHEVYGQVHTLQEFFDDLSTHARSCGINEENPDTCGVCGHHFAECDADQRGVFAEGEEADIPANVEPACPGARVRVILESFDRWQS